MPSRPRAASLYPWPDLRTGAAVGVERGRCPGAGGPYYLHRFATERTLTVLARKLSECLCSAYRRPRSSPVVSALLQPGTAVDQLTRAPVPPLRTPYTGEP